MLGTIHVCKYLMRNVLIRAYCKNESLGYHRFTNKFFVNLFFCEHFKMGYIISIFYRHVSITTLKKFEFETLESTIFSHSDS